ncbi:hypothetical protein [Blautia difficilis]|uniref:hypothetical protein n=1 Tax=Blautia difficilis TaxID=2763027 RepID=UPI003D986E33
MLDQKDIQLLEKMFEKFQQNIINTVDEKITHSETRILKEVDNKINASETKMQKEFDAKMDEKFTNFENVILRKLNRMQERMDKRMDDIQKNIDELNQYYRISKMESDKTSVLLQMYSDMQKQIAEIQASTSFSK